MTRSRPESGQFFNRTSESGIIDEQVALLGALPARFVVLEVTGQGGVGKSRFLEQTSDRLAARADPPKLLRVKLDDEISMTAIAPLLVIRNQLTIDCYLFDSAVLTYWFAMHQQRQTIGQDGTNSLAVRTLKAEGEVGQDLLPPDFAAMLFSNIARDDALRLGYSGGEFTQIDALREHTGDLFALLPKYLGLDIARRLRNPNERRLVFFYDGYEKQSVRTLAGRAQWLRTFIDAVHSGIHLIAVRDPLGWNATELGDHVVPIPLGELPDAECRRMIRRALGDLERDVEDRLVAGSKSVPFYLRALIDVFRAEFRQHGAVRVGDLPERPPAVVEHFLDHLSPSAYSLALMLAALQYFDEPLYAHLVHSAGLPVDIIGMNDFVEWFFVEDVGAGLYKTHDLLTEEVRDSSRFAHGVTDALRSAAVNLEVRTNEMPSVGAQRLPQLFNALVEGWQGIKGMRSDDAEQLIDIGYNLYDAGYWHGLIQLPGIAPDGGSHPARVSAQYFAALATRRTMGPVRALERLTPLAPMRKTMGRHAASFDIEMAYLREISGDYAYARSEFRRLNDEAAPYDPVIRAHRRARLYHADMLTMDGELAEANELLAEASELLESSSSLDRAEMIRHRGHVYRFSLEFRAAEERYAVALEASGDSPSMKGKLRTNLAEARCWHDPSRALKDADVAIDLNTRLGSQIEVAKAHAARGVAFAQLRQFDEAKAACEAAMAISGDVGYPAAGCFARQALVVLEVRSGNYSRAAEAYEALIAGIDELGTYGHLAVIPAWIRGDDVEFRRRSAAVSWIPGRSPGAGLELISRPGR